MFFLSEIFSSFFSLSPVLVFLSLSPRLSSNCLRSEFSYSPVNMEAQRIFKTSRREHLNKRETSRCFIANTASVSCKHPPYYARLQKANLYLNLTQTGVLDLILDISDEISSRLCGYFYCLFVLKTFLSFRLNVCGLQKSNFVLWRGIWNENVVFYLNVMSSYSSKMSEKNHDISQQVPCHTQSRNVTLR